MNNAIRIVINLSLAGLCVSAFPQDRPKPQTDIRKLQPLTGVPTSTLNAPPAEDLKKWFQSLTITTGLDATTVFQQMPPAWGHQTAALFDGDKFKPEASAKMLKRLNSLSPKDFRPWEDACSNMMGAQCVDTALALGLLSVDLLFKEDSYASASGQKYLNRVKQLSRSSVERWCVVVPAFNNDQLNAALIIATLDHFFVGEKFDLGAFDKALGN